MFGRILALAAGLALSACATSQANEVQPETAKLPTDQQAFLDACEPWDDWDKPAPPFKIYGNSYYVGTCGISAILVTGDDGHILIDTGTDPGADVVAANIEALGLTLSDVRAITHSHEHFDHVGGLAKMTRLTGADVIASVGAVGALNSGQSSPDDPQHDMHEPMSPVKVSAMVEDQNIIERGSIMIEAIATPGHTPGALSWQWESCDYRGENCKTIVYADSLSPVSADGYRFSDHPEYVAEYYAGIDRLGAVDCDILIAAHPSHGQMFKWLDKGSLLAMDKPCQAYAAKKRSDLDKRLAREATDKAGGE